MTEEHLRIVAAQIATTRSGQGGEGTWRDYAAEAYEFISGSDRAENSNTEPAPTERDPLLDALSDVRDQVRESAKLLSQRATFLAMLDRIEKAIK